MPSPATSYKPKGFNNINPMLHFDGDCAEALELYKVSQEPSVQTDGTQHASLGALYL